MYENHFGFCEKPFSLIPDPKFLYLGESHNAAASLLEYGVMEQTGFVILTGDIGSGKTTLIRGLLRRRWEGLLRGTIPG